jgi:hypothetical protein
MRHRLALVDQALWAAVQSLAFLQITHGCQARLSLALSQCSETWLDGSLRGLANPENSLARSRASGTGVDHATACSPQPVSRQNTRGGNAYRRHLLSVAGGSRSMPLSRILYNSRRRLSREVHRSVCKLEASRSRPRDRVGSRLQCRRITSAGQRRVGGNPCR